MTFNPTNLLSMLRKIVAIIGITFCCTNSSAQIGEHRNEFSVGCGAGYALSSVSFTPRVTQKMHGGMSAGIMGRYTTEKYFSMICSLQAELNFTQMGWTEDIKDKNDQPVVNPDNGLIQEYSRTINYIQLPILAHLAWGKEHGGANFFFNAGPQFGYMISESSKANLLTKKDDNGNIALNEQGKPIYSSAGRSNACVEQYNMPAENKLDYGIAAGLGVEMDVRHIGRFQLEGRYYYGLGNIYGDSKRDYFASSNFSTIYIRAAYLFDLH